MKLSAICQYLSTVDDSLLAQDCDVSGVSTDTRHIKPGDIFVALRGGNFDGHQFITQAIARGACAVVVDKPLVACDVPQLIVKDTTRALGQVATGIRDHFLGVLVAITGSCGKTSVKGLLRSIFELAGNTLATQGNFNNHIGVPLTLNQLLPSHQYAVIEMGASGLGEIEYLASMAKPAIAMVNNVQPSHVEGFGSINAIACEKGKIYDALGGESATAVINCDDVYAPQFIAQTRHVNQLGFSVKRTVSEPNIPLIQATHIKPNKQGFYAFIINYNNQMQAVQLRVPGEHFVANALAATACALAAGISLPEIAKGLSRYEGEAGRMQAIPAFFADQKALIINDAYNANPASVRAAIDYLAAIQLTNPEQLCILVLGDMGELGESEQHEHSEVGIYAREKGLTHLMTVGPLAALAAQSFGSCLVFDAVSEAEPQLREFLTHDATILLKASRSTGMDTIIPLLAEHYIGNGEC